MTQEPSALDLTHQAIHAHQAGDLDEAARLYAAALAQDPQSWLALANQAVLWMQTGRLEEGVEGVKASLAIAPSQPSALKNMGAALRVLGRLDEAIAAYREAVALQASYVEAWVELGQTLQQAGRPLEAADAYGAAAALLPAGHADLWRLRHVQGLLLYENGRKAEALAALRQAEAESPPAPEFYNDLGIVTHDNDRAEEAVAAFDKALALNPDYADAYSNKARALHHLGRIEEALAGLDRAVALAPDNLLAWRHRGDAFSALGRFEQALACHDQTLRLAPGDADSWVRRGDVLGFLRRIEESMTAYNQALTLDPGNIKAPFNLAAHLIREGVYGDGWRLYEHRWRDKTELMPVLPGRLWLGEEEVAGKTILVHSEQGQGDAIMMLRYVPLLARRGAKVLLSIQQPLERLAASVEGAAAVIPQGQPLPPFDLHVPMMSLPLAFGTEVDTVPGEPYLKADPADVAHWAERLGPHRRPRIGMAWAGNPTHNEDRWRSIPLDALRPLTGLDAELYAVMVDIRERDRAAAADMGLNLLGPELTDYASTAGLIENLDLVISVDTSLAHLTGAMGRRGFLLLPAAPDYRWGWEGDSPWYPSLRLFRQKRIGDWSEVAEAVKAAAAAELHLP